ncbi:MAG: phosphoribosylamine--glycine ligase [Melioribacteraceae bacterium]|nr:phosphoribosylamine--glycine ligase [Melioribacteraceae bacterium]
MNVVLIGSGGREHALARKISKSKSLSKLYILPGNPGTGALGENVNVDVSNFDETYNFCFENEISFVIIGPEQPLVDGLGDFLIEKGLKVFGPTKAAAQIEGDKSFSKNLMKNYGIPTASFEVFDKEDYENALTYVKTAKYPLVVKASGLAAGKGVLICEDQNSAVSAIKECFKDGAFGAAGDKVVVEEFMYGFEASLFAITDGTDFISLPIAQDHKRIGDGDTGKNTGGMGAYAPAPLVDSKLQEEVEKIIIQPTLDAMKSENAPFVGCLYCGLMITSEGPKVVEFNCRFGDPETQVVLPLLEGDFLQLLYSAAAGKIDKNSVKYSGGAAICVVASSKGYPGSYKKGLKITGIEDAESEEIVVYHAGTKKEGNDIVTSGGRVLGVTAVSKENDLKACKTKAYEGIDKIKFDGIYFRKDISDKAFQNLD